jgi:hypothetical protein
MAVSFILSIIVIVISLGAVGISALLVVRQIRFQRHANEVPIAITIGQEYRTAEFQQAFNYVTKTLAEDHHVGLGLTNLLADSGDYALRVARFFTWLSGLVFFDIVDEELIVGLLGSPINRSWEALEPYILQERVAQGYPDAYVFYEDLVCRIRERGLQVDEYSSKLKRLTPRSAGPPETDA